MPRDMGKPFILVKQISANMKDDPVNSIRRQGIKRYATVAQMTYKDMPPKEMLQRFAKSPEMIRREKPVRAAVIIFLNNNTLRSFIHLGDRTSVHD